MVDIYKTLICPESIFFVGFYPDNFHTGRPGVGVGVRVRVRFEGVTSGIPSRNTGNHTPYIFSPPFSMQYPSYIRIFT